MEAVTTFLVLILAAGQCVPCLECNKSVRRNSHSKSVGQNQKFAGERHQSYDELSPALLSVLARFHPFSIVIE
jgi:hypothetical protein